jgi:hypothetical protein
LSGCSVRTRRSPTTTWPSGDTPNCRMRSAATAGSRRVTTCEEFDRALEQAGKTDSGVYIEVVTGTYAASPLAQKLHESVKSLYKS